MNSYANVFLKELLIELFTLMGKDFFAKKLLSSSLQQFTKGLFPMENKEDVECVVFFYNGCGLIDLLEKYKILVKEYQDNVNQSNMNE